MDSKAVPSNVSVTKYQRGKLLKCDNKLMVFKIFNKLNEKYLTLAIKDLKKLTSEFTGVSEVVVLS